MARADAPHILIVEARFYDDMADALLEGASFALKEAGATGGDCHGARRRR
jgi:6,7-dimethyl-8-ribityllumazine synthase